MSKYKRYITVGESTKDFVSYEIRTVENDDSTSPYVENEDRLASYTYIQEKLKSLTGKILTIVDASMPENRQSKCVKDLMRKEFLNMFQEISNDLVDLTKYVICPGTDDLPETVSAKEILGA